MIAPIPTNSVLYIPTQVNSHDTPPLSILPILHPLRSLNNDNNNPLNNHPPTHFRPHLLHPQRLPRLASPRPRRHPPNTKRLPPHLSPPPLRPPQPPRSSTTPSNPTSTRWLPSLKHNIKLVAALQTRPPPRRPRHSTPPPNNPNRQRSNLRSPHDASCLDCRHARTLARIIRGHILLRETQRGHLLRAGVLLPRYL